MPLPDPLHHRTVFIVDDDAAVRDSLSLLLSLHGHVTAVFASAENFLRVLRPDWTGCILADIRMPGMSGLEMQRLLLDHPARLPVIVITGHGDIAAARQAFKANAVDFLEKPFDDRRLLQAIEAALARVPPPPSPTANGLRTPSLSPREREVRDLVVAGLDNGAVAQALGISPRTVEVHKARVLAKLGVRNLAELLKMSLTGRAPK